MRTAAALGSVRTLCKECREDNHKFMFCIVAQSHSRGCGEAVGFVCTTRTLGESQRVDEPCSNCLG